jgi:hypothetical protein
MGVGNKGTGLETDNKQRPNSKMKAEWGYHHSNYFSRRTVFIHLSVIKELSVMVIRGFIKESRHRRHGNLSNLKLAFWKENISKISC